MASMATVNSGSSSHTHEPKRIADYFFMVGLRDDFELIAMLAPPATAPPPCSSPTISSTEDAFPVEDNCASTTHIHTHTRTNTYTHSPTHALTHPHTTATTAATTTTAASGTTVVTSISGRGRGRGGSGGGVSVLGPPILELNPNDRTPSSSSSSPLASPREELARAPLEPVTTALHIYHQNRSTPDAEGGSAGAAPGAGENTGSAGDGSTTPRRSGGENSVINTHNISILNPALDPDRLWSPGRHRSKSMAHFDKKLLSLPPSPLSPASKTVDDDILTAPRFRLHGSTVHPAVTTTTITNHHSPNGSLRPLQGTSGGSSTIASMGGGGVGHSGSHAGGATAILTTTAVATGVATTGAAASLGGGAAGGSTATAETAAGRLARQSSTISQQSLGVGGGRPRRSMTVSNISASSSSSMSSGRQPSLLLHRGPSYRNMSAGTLFKAVQEGIPLEKAVAAAVASSGASVTTGSSIVESIPEETSSLSETTIEGDDAQIQTFETDTGEDRPLHTVPRIPPTRLENPHAGPSTEKSTTHEELNNMARQNNVIRSRSKVIASASQARTPNGHGYHPPSSPQSHYHHHQQHQSSQPHYEQTPSAEQDHLSSLEERYLASTLTHGHLADVVIEPEVLCRYPEIDWEDAEPFPTNLHKFCFPSRLTLKVSEEQPAATYHSFVLTRETGGRSYATCVTIYERPSEALKKQCEILCKKWTETHLSESEVEYVKAIKEKLARERKIRRSLKEALKEEKKNGRRPRQLQLKREIIDTEEKLLLLEDQMKPWRDLYLDVDDIWVPRSIGLVSAIPYHYLMRDWLLGVVVACTGFLEHPGMSLYSLPLERYVKNLIHEVQLPPFGRYEVAITINNRFLYASRPAINSVPIVKNFSLFPLFRCLSAEDIVTVIEVILSEGKIIFLSSHLGMLTLASESFLYLLFPLYWQGVYIPILPAEMMTCVQAPVPYIIGIERKHRDHPDFIPDDACIVDLDLGVIEVPIPPIQIPHRQRKKLIQSLEQYAPTSAAAASHRQGNHHQHSQSHRSPSGKHGSGGVIGGIGPLGPPAYVCEAFPHSRLTLFCGVSRAPRYTRRPNEMARPLSTQMVFNASANGSMASVIGQNGVASGSSGHSVANGGGVSRKGSLSSLSSINRQQPPTPTMANGSTTGSSLSSLMGSMIGSSGGISLPKIPKVEFEKEALQESGLERRNSSRSPLSTESPVKASRASTESTSTKANGHSTQRFQRQQRQLSSSSIKDGKAAPKAAAVAAEVYIGGGLAGALSSQDDLHQEISPLSHNSASDTFKASSHHRKVMSPPRMKAGFFDATAVRKLDVTTVHAGSATTSLSNVSSHSHSFGPHNSNGSTYSSASVSSNHHHHYPTTAATTTTTFTATPAVISRTNTNSSITSTQSISGAFHPLHDSRATLTRQTSFTSIESTGSSIFSRSPMSYLQGMSSSSNLNGNSSNGSNNQLNNHSSTNGHVGVNGGTHVSQANGSVGGGTSMHSTSNSSSTKLNSPGSVSTNNTMSTINGSGSPAPTTATTAALPYSSTISHHATAASTSSTASTGSVSTVKTAATSATTLTTPLSTPAAAAAAAAAASANMLNTPKFDEDILVATGSDVAGGGSTTNGAGPLPQIVLEGHVLGLLPSPLTHPVTSYRCGICTHGFAPSNEAYKCDSCSLHAHSGCLDELLYPCVPRGFDESGVCWSVLQMWASLLKGYRSGIIAGNLAKIQQQQQYLLQQHQQQYHPLRQGRAASSGSEDGATTASVSTRGGGGMSERLSWASFKGWATRSTTASTTSVNTQQTLLSQAPNPPRPSTSSTTTFATTTTTGRGNSSSVMLGSSSGGGGGGDGASLHQPLKQHAHGASDGSSASFTRSRNGTENSGFSSSTIGAGTATGGVVMMDTIAFHLEIFLKSIDKEARPFMDMFTKSQAFAQFIEDRVERSPGDPEIMFFDEVIKAKINRSRFRLGKEETKFLDDPSYGIQMTVRAVPPSGDAIHLDETKSRRFPTRLDPELLK
ncbi:hypothetical protein BGW41_003576 [Actinomortierella wolfii]|nr:hypothetical protein BGW41_003576 [Actinomortierella wolfii]